MDKQKEIRKPVQSSTLKCGKRTFFFDCYVASNNKRYLKITESAFVGENGERRRNSFLLWPEDILNFQQRVEEIKGYLAE